uniref:Leucine rich repeat containing 27 n=1 Tax=Chelonoidis abingdonii TaxID=106734 RepID=A0A8C0IXL1_CHEAB
MDENLCEESCGGGDGYLENEDQERRHLSGSSSSKDVRKAVEDTLSTTSNSLDLSRKKLQHLTEEIYKLPNLKHLHLEGNALAIIPKDLFQQLPNLVWLDLRYNKIKTLPPGIGCHKQLKTLLLERNPIKRLPVELGNLTSLTALNLRHCPLEFPPKDVVQRGLRSILCFLRNVGNGKLVNLEPDTQGICLPLWDLGNLQLLFSNLLFTPIEMPPVEKLNLTELMKSSLDLSDEWPNEEEMLRFQKLRKKMVKDEKEEFLANQDLNPKATMQEFPWHLFHYKLSTWRSPQFQSYDKMIRAKRAEEFRLAVQKELKETQALIEQQQLPLLAWCSCRGPRWSSG